MFLLQRKCGNCLHRPPPEALAVDQLVLGGQHNAKVKEEALEKPT